MSLVACAISGFLIALVSSLYLGTRKGKGGLLPPGPRGFPIVGSGLQINNAEPWVTFSKWGVKYGGLVYCRAFGQGLFIVNSERVAHELLDKRSSNYSDRTFAKALDVFGWEWNPGFLGYNDTWRTSRRIFHLSLNQDAVRQFRPMQMNRAHRLLCDLLDDPNEFEKYYREHSASIILSATYGHDTTKNDELVSLIETSVAWIVKFGTPLWMGMMDAFPFIARVPKAFFGIGVKEMIEDCRWHMEQMVKVPYQRTLAYMAEGDHKPSIVANALRKEIHQPVSEYFEWCVSGAAGAAYSAGADTTYTTLQVFTMLMVLHPDVQRRAHEQIDSAVGFDRLPTFEDRGSLPLIDAILRETLRWSPAVRVNIPHGVTDDDVYDGYFIPKGTNIVVNIWGIFHDEGRYENHMQFNPDRFLDSKGHLTEDDSHMLAFGFGRRICAGRHLAEATLWSAISCILAAFEFSRAIDQNGNEVDINPKWTVGLTNCPTEFKCSITPREGCKARVEEARLAAYGHRASA
ncbi:cytochrome P450 [Coniophora puteana RWD-64-598 SS2]|uniref:Cytochrome P450 n=1 Tax=Coniophora puteana (strain RWD-64-598) TaxID=741705 RepID=A0A5M3N3M3_CONPW|nr:cytochrome P450 [Coniophora puteana RWD-64-598 SS2]EIW86002.1 cytochrome P450 [Coniophora puteana RWD-64-598 SS2]